MGEEEKKAEAAEEKKMEEKKAAEEKKEEEKKEDGEEDAKKKTQEDSKDSQKDSKEDSPPQPPPQEIVLKVYMHCEGCARKVRRCLKGFEGVEDVMTDCKTGKVVVKGEKADPLKVLGRVQRKTHRHVDLLSPLPPPPPEKKPEAEAENPKPEEKKQETPVVVTVVLKVHMHCEACAMEIKKRIQRMKGVESAEADLKSSQVTVIGVFEPPKLVEYVYKRTGKHATVAKGDPPPPPPPAEEEEKKKKEGQGDNGGGGESKGEEGKGEMGKSAEEKKEADGGGDKGEGKASEKEGGGGDGEGVEEGKIVEVKKIENPYYYHYSYYPPRMAVEMYAYPPQMFSDENPNACTVM